jgi:hypothetical protein
MSREQGNWKFFLDDSAEPVIQLADENVKPTLSDSNLQRTPYLEISIIRCRVALYNILGDGMVLMQYSTDDVNFNDFGPDADWNYADGKATEGNQVTSLKLSSTTIYGNYYESGILSENFTIPETEIDFAIKPINVTPNTTYYFRFLWKYISEPG